MRTILATLAFAILAAATPAGAQGQNNRWCADYGRGGYSNCGFATFEQCRATISGFNQGSCYPNPQYQVDRRYSR